MTEAWPTLSDAEQGLAVDALKSFADDVQRRMKIPLTLRETDHFLFDSDLPDDVVARSIKRVDETYVALASRLDVPKGKNIWRGKALIFVFSKQADYRRFEKTVHSTNPGRAAGMCHCLPNGDVHVAFYREADETEFLHVLVHETVHGFLHRLKTPADVPSWIDEGFAETIACEMSPQEGRAERTLDYARRGVALNGGLGGMLDADQIERWQYPIAQIMSEYLIQQDKRAFASFILDVKGGDPWERALKDRFHLTRDELVREFDRIIESKDAKEKSTP